MPRRKPKVGKLAIIALPVVVFGVSFFVSQGWPAHPPVWSGAGGGGQLTYVAATPVSVSAEPAIIVGPPPIVVTHLPPPRPLRALYMTSWVAGTPTIRERLITLADTTEINALVIDIKDYTGRIAWLPEDPELAALGAGEARVAEIKKFLADLHARDLYLIGRISVFQDQYLVSQRPELAVKRASDGGVWRDRKGIAWLDPGSAEVWEYIVRLAREAYAVGFDEVNFDYIRFPSDGNMRDITYAETLPTGVIDRPAVLQKFFVYQQQELADLPVVRSVDFFGLTTVNPDDLGIGQVLERALPYFDYVAPMVYPSHYASGFIGLARPAEYPYEVVKYSLDKAAARAVAASSTPAKIRPWLQDFDLGADYTAELVRAEKQAVYDAGLDSWMLWDPANRYTIEALD